jgi:tight adherence protein C
MDVLAVLLAILAIIFLSLHFAGGAARRARTLTAAGLAEERGTAPRLGLTRLRPILGGRLARLGAIAAPRLAGDLEDLIAASGSALSVLHLQGIRVCAALASACLALPLGLMALPLAPALAALGYHLPVIYLKRKRRLRWESIARDLPEVADLMAVLCFSGESLLQALQHSVGACNHPPARQEMEAMVERIRLGESTAEVLGRAARHPCPELRRFGRTLLRAEEHGAPIADTLEELAGDLRAGRREKDRVRAARGSVLVLFPLVFLILPSFLLLTIGGMLLGYTL